jgi:hypothetical protein
MFSRSGWVGFTGVALLWAGTSWAVFPDCPPVSDAEAVESWKSAAIRAISEGDPSQVSSRVDACFQAQAPACVQRVRDFAERMNVIDSGSTDAEAKDDPRKQPPRELLLAVDDQFSFELSGDAELIAKQRGWPVVRYKSRFSGGFDGETPSLVMIRVPGDKVTPPVDYDRYLNIPLPADPTDEEMNPVPQQPMPSPDDFRGEVTSGRQLPRTFTIVTVQKKSGADLSKVYFQMFNRSGGGSARFNPQPPSSVTGCYGCHTNGVREISPLGYHVRAGERQMPPESWKAVKEMNDSMAKNMGFAPADWRGANDPQTGRPRKYLVAAGYGPFIGPLLPLTRERKVDASGNEVISFPTRTKEFILGSEGQPGCFQRRQTVAVTDIFGRPPGRNNIYRLSAEPAIRWQKVRDAMNCTSCHNNKQRGALNEGTSWSEIDFKILVDQSMPWGWHRNPMDRGDPSKPVIDLLTADERIALSNCLQAEWELEQSKTTEWLGEVSCQSR